MDSYLSSDTKINSKWTLGNNVRARSIKLLEENIGANLCDLDLDNGFLVSRAKHK